MSGKRFKCLISILAILLSLPSMTGAQMIAVAMWNMLPTGEVVQKTSNYGAVGSIDVAYPANVTQNNLLVVCASANSGPTIADSANHDWALIQSVNANAVARCWYATAKASGPVTVTIGSTGGFVVVTLLEVSGMVTLDQSASLAGTGATVSVSTPATEDNNNFVLAYVHDWDNYVTWTPGSGYTIEHLADSNGSGYITAVESRMSQGAGVKTATFTKNYPGDTWGAIVMAFKPTPNIVTLRQKAKVNVTGTSVSATFSQPVKVGSMLIACVNAENYSGFSDNLNGAYTSVLGVGTIACAFVSGVVAGTTTVTATRSDSGPVGMVIMEITGRLNTCNTALGWGNSSSTVTSTSDPITRPASYVFGIVGSYWSPVQSRTFSIDAGSAADWTLQEQFAPDGGNYQAAWIDLNQKAGLSGTRTYTVNASSTVDYFLGSVLTCE